MNYKNNNKNVNEKKKLRKIIIIKNKITNRNGMHH